MQATRLTVGASTSCSASTRPVAKAMAARPAVRCNAQQINMQNGLYVVDSAPAMAPR